MNNFNKGGRGGFSNRGGNSGFGNRGGNSGFGNRGGNSGFGGRRQGRPEMYQATCSDCGKGCEVPFRPTQGKPVLCSDCFKGGNDRGGRFERPARRDFGERPSGSSEDKFEKLDKKLDKILKLLEIINDKKTHIIMKPEIEISSDKTEKTKPAKKKSEVKKPAKKKAVKKNVKKAK